MGQILLMMAMVAPVWAHHSAVGYDRSKTIGAHATLKEFRWGAPHSTAVFEIQTAGGKVQEITVASAAPSMFFKQGFKPRDFKAGDNMDITWHPARSGIPGGQLASVKLADGRTFKDTEFLGTADNAKQAGAKVP